MVSVDTTSVDAPAANMTTYSINHEATIDLDSTNAFEGKKESCCSWEFQMLNES